MFLIIRTTYASNIQIARFIGLSFRIQGKPIRMSLIKLFIRTV